MHRLGDSSQRCQSAPWKAGSCHSLSTQHSPSCNISVKGLNTKRRGPQGVQRRLMAHKSATGNGVQAERRAEARSREPENSSSVTHLQRGPAIQDAETKVKVSDKLKAAVKQVDKSAYEVTALPMRTNQDVSLAPHRHEHPGSCTSLLPVTRNKMAPLCHKTTLTCSDDGLKAIATMPLDPHRRHAGHGERAHDTSKLSE